jgi:hypothetical protein
MSNHEKSFTLIKRHINPPTFQDLVFALYGLSDFGPCAISVTVTVDNPVSTEKLSRWARDAGHMLEPDARVPGQVRYTLEVGGKLNRAGSGLDTVSNWRHRACCLSNLPVSVGKSVLDLDNHCEDCPHREHEEE